MVQRMYEIRPALDPRHRTDQAFRERLLHACQKTHICRSVVANPPDNVFSLVNALTRDIEGYETAARADRAQPLSTEMLEPSGSTMVNDAPSTHVTDRIYHQPDRTGAAQ